MKPGITALIPFFWQANNNYNINYFNSDQFNYLDLVKTKNTDIIIIYKSF